MITTAPPVIATGGLLRVTVSFDRLNRADAPQVWYDMEEDDLTERGMEEARRQTRVSGHCSAPRLVV